MTTYEDLKKHCESVPINHMGMRIACVQADTILELIARVEDLMAYAEGLQHGADSLRASK